MEENKQASSQQSAANPHQRHFTIFDLVPILVALAIAAYAANYAATRFGVLASILAFAIVSVLAFLFVGYAFHIVYAFLSWLCRFVFRHK
jgi:predicted membrane protein